MKLSKLHEDVIPGGLGDDIDFGDALEKFGLLRIWKGIKVELEHTSDKNVAFEIAVDHLVEDKDYYEKLEEVHMEGNGYPGSSTGGMRSMPSKIWPEKEDIDSEKESVIKNQTDELASELDIIPNEPDDWVKPRFKKGPGD